ncbi:ATP-binding cassette domain-containing protein [Pseudobowmanella zhangzhouensis]|uniref:ATP-binding cassette domain-containing protein n=1 Tax=Pseudobowmanella zhangzhouensis TaxID=1537679 RepID=UPI003610F495
MLHADSICLAQRLREISLTLAGGRCVHLIGPNGAGKSSLLSVLAGVLTPDSGQVSYNQIPLDSLSPADLTAIRGYQAQGLHTAFSLTVADVMAFFVTNNAARMCLIRHWKSTYSGHDPLTNYPAANSVVCIWR